MLIRLHFFSLNVLCASFLGQAAFSQDLAPIAIVPITDDITEEVASFLAENSVQSKSFRTSGPIADLVRENCGSASPNNLKVFGLAVRNQGGTIDSEGIFSVPAQHTLVPQCLPDERERRLVGRLPASGDTLSKIIERDVPGGYYQTAFGGGDRPASPSPPEIALGAGDDRAYVFSVVGIDLAGLANAGDDPSVKAKISEAISDYFESLHLGPSDRSRLAYESFAMSSELLGAGLDPTATRAVVERALHKIGAAQVNLVLGDVDAALLTRQKVPPISEIPISQDWCAPTPSLCNAEASGKTVWLDTITADIATELNPRNRVRDIDTIYRSVPILSIERAAPEAKVRLRASVPASAPVEIVTEGPNSPSKVKLFLNVDDSTVDKQKQCSEGHYRNWATDEFRKDFREALERALAEKVARDNAAAATWTLVLDGGFFRFDTAPFGGADWNAIPSYNRHAALASMQGMPADQVEKIEHGTAVTSIALGGPGLMDLGPKLNLPITVESKPIYRLKPGAPRSEYVLIDNIGDVIAIDGPHIVNISFGTTNDDDAMISEIERTLLGRNGKLLIVAAGNLGNNDMNSVGNLVSSAGLLPQKWGGSEHGKWNMIVVAGMDPSSGPSRLAWFSNFGEDVVFLGAPGCDVPALRATPQGTYEEATFNGTSFAAPIVTFVASAVRSVMPRERISAPWVRARLLATAEIESGVYHNKIREGRVLDPISAVQVYSDIVTLREPLANGERVLVGDILEIAGEPEFKKGSLCDAQFNRPHQLLRLFREPGSVANGGSWQVDLMGPTDVMETQPCTPRGAMPLVIQTDQGSETLRIDMIDDIKFGFARRIK